MTVLAFGSVDTTVSFFSEAIHLYCFFMSGEVPTVLIFGHSFVKRLHRDLQSNFHSRADESLNLRGTASVFFSRHRQPYRGEASVFRSPRGRAVWA